MNATTFYIVGGGLVLIQFWFELEYRGHTYGSKQNKEAHKKGENEIEAKKDSSFWYGLTYKLVTLVNKRILAKIGAIIIIIGLLIQIIE
ncbi:MAG TPA: hypothetical protein PLM93_02540 [Sulfuricurvum sp.]|nr:MAG: hypothetical protein B7Y30_00515 [Campylobacterales bacterium 16-40-21]OZA04049.1 MAG: hypothetical protein B7X89_00395 [Sulfuricurvum sp. 17-40-25]HQS66050.1 hypothetical protein [Sulfuricurvum sp.]HQT35906.1 hypothetical protein [Sulfuricurvum sp.]